VQLGLHLNGYDWAGGAARLDPMLGEIARAAEDAGFDRIGVANHVWRSSYRSGKRHDF
jgi:alkanesulfonate monooxygenase SsuD/methylene tetrahydromethanopterin reductase-like flavin-dependent oxidoreductase (luciferase family)